MCGTAAIGSMLALGTAIRLDLARRWQGGGKAGVSANKLAERAFAPRSSGPGWARTWHGRADGTCLRLDEEPGQFTGCRPTASAMQQRVSGRFQTV